MSFHPARLAIGILAILAVVVAILLLRVRATGSRIRPIYREHFSVRHRERQLFAATAFYISFAVVRILTHSIRAGRGPFHNLEVGGRHIHHLVWGILLLLGVGYCWLLQLGTDLKTRSPWAGRALAALYGIGAALTLDEFALWLNLRDVYWERQGRASIDAVVLFGALLMIGAAGGGFIKKLVHKGPHAEYRRPGDEAPVVDRHG